MGSAPNEKAINKWHSESLDTSVWGRAERLETSIVNKGCVSSLTSMCSQFTWALPPSPREKKTKVLHNLIFAECVDKLPITENLTSITHDFSVISFCHNLLHSLNVFLVNSIWKLLYLRSSNTTCPLFLGAPGVKVVTCSLVVLLYNKTIISSCAYW